MDGSRFDGITRALATGQTRRHALQGLVGGAFAGLLGFSGLEDAAAGCVKANKKGCKGPKNGKCCDGARCQGGSQDKEGKCVCKGGHKKCGSECVNTKKDRKHCGGCNKACKGQNSCKGGTCTSKLGCKKGGASLCDGPPLTGLDDPRICGGDLENSLCICITDVNGVARCADLVGAQCADCTSNGDCPDGFVCIKANFGNCACQDVPGSNGNACIRADCQGISGSSVGGGGRRRLLTTPLLR